MFQYRFLCVHSHRCARRAPSVRCSCSASLTSRASRKWTRPSLASRTPRPPPETSARSSSGRGTARSPKARLLPPTFSVLRRSGTGTSIRPSKPRDFRLNKQPTMPGMEHSFFCSNNKPNLCFSTHASCQHHPFRPVLRVRHQPAAEGAAATNPNEVAFVLNLICDQLWCHHHTQQQQRVPSGPRIDPALI